MRCFRLLTAIAVLAMAAQAWADDNLPPVPKSASRTIATLTVKDALPPTPAPTPAPAKVEATAIIKVRTAPAEEASCEAAPLPPVSGKVETYKHCCHCTCACCQAKKVHPICFLANEFLRKPIYSVEKAMNDADGRRICCENCRLNKESERLAAEAARLAEKLKNCPHDLDAKFKLLREEAAYAKDANRNAVRRAKLECKQADYCTQKNKLEEKHNELFPVRD